MGEFQISKSDFTQVRVIESDFHDHQLANGQILVQVEQFAYTTNNISFVENSLHRKDLDLFYNQYEIVTENLHYSRADDNARMVFGPLHQTAFVMLHFLQDNAWKGAEQIIILSASSKTSLGMAYGFCNADAKPTLVGVTSSKKKVLLLMCLLY